MPRVSPLAFHRIALVLVVSYALLVLTGGAVRLTGSGLGCLDWPTCSQGHLVASASFHPLVEFTNRCVTVAVSVVSVVAFLAALLRSPYRRDLVGPAAVVLGGLAAQVVLGGLVVLFKLNPYLVALHFTLTLAVLAVALVLLRRNLEPSGPAVPLLGRELLRLDQDPARHPHGRGAGRDGGDRLGPPRGSGGGEADRHPLRARRRAPLDPGAVPHRDDPGDPFRPPPGEGARPRSSSGPGSSSSCSRSRERSATPSTSSTTPRSSSSSTWRA